METRIETSVKVRYSALFLHYITFVSYFQVQAEGGVDEEFEVLLVRLVLVGSLDLRVAGACPALMDLRDPKVRTATGVSLDHPDPKERVVTLADLVLPVSYQK